MNLPEPFTNRIRLQWPGSAQAFFRALETAPPVSIRLNPAKPSSPFPGLPVPWCKTGLYLAERPSFTGDPLFHAGCYYVQEAASMFLEQALQMFLPKEPCLALDVCAAPGGKSTHLLSLLPEGSLLVSNEVIHSRAMVLKENLLKWGAPGLVISSSDPRDFSRLSEQFDLLLVDAPCSGEGLFRKEPMAIREWSPAGAEACSLHQQRMLDDCIPLLKEGGLLIYSTCTYNPAENEAQVERLRTLGFTCLPLRFDAVDPANAPVPVPVGSGQAYRFLPPFTRGEGLFLSILRKEKTIDRPVTSPEKKAPGDKTAFQEWPESSRVSPWMKRPETFRILRFQDQLFAVSAAHESFIRQLQQSVSVLYAGVELATLKNEKLIPAHGLALSVAMNPDPFPRIPLTREQAVQYLKKETFPLPMVKKGWAVVTYEGHSLGWIHQLENRFNNNYPTGWRIRL